MDEPAIESSFHTFTLPQVLTVVGTVVNLPRAAKRNRTVLFSTLESFPPETRRRIREVAGQYRGTKRKAGSSARTPSKRTRVDGPDGEVVDEDVEGEPVVEIDVDMDIQEGPFFAPPTQVVTEAAIARMIDRSGNAAVAKKTCMVCARKLWLKLLEPTAVVDIPNARRLAPTNAHPAHRLTRGMLLHERCLGDTETYVCIECKRKLLLDEKPALSLANGMWIGCIPFALRILTLPERLLVALYFPAAYVVKLFPKIKGAQLWDRKSVNSGLKGNVSTYRLNTAQIAGIAAGNTMPPSPRILAATIAVTFVGAGKKPLAVLPDLFRVRRQRVFDALLWLKDHNDLYRLIDISADQLRLLPEDGVPDEISMNARYSDDVGALEREQAGYVPMDVADEEAEAAAAEMNARFEEREISGPSDEPPEETVEEDYDPGVFPLQAHGVIDVQADTVPDSDLAAHAFANLASRPAQDEFVIRKSSAFINEYARKDEHGQRFDGGPDNPNHMLGAFPVLFPYGKGGLEVDREVTVAYESHVRWALEYDDGRFRSDFHFIFQAFGVIQKRQVCRSAALQIKRSAFISNQVAFLKLKPHDLLQASAEETRRVPFSNPVIRALRKQLTSLRSRVSGTDESRISIRGQVWGMNLRFNPPSIWATINLADTSDPVAQVLAGQDIDLDNFIATAGPERTARAVNIAGDPFAAAEFFHITIRAIIEELFGITANRKGKMIRAPGIVGVVNGYIGTVEAQARGTLHLHILFWLQGAPTAEGMRNALQTEAFRAKVRSFLKETIRADIRGTTADSVLQLEKRSGVAYSRPEDPRLPDYEHRRELAEASIARAVQVHKCTVNTCLKTKNGRLVCKRRAPWPLATEDWVLPSGDWGPRRLYGRMNAWNPPLLQVTRSNQDMKIITNGQDTKDITFYITMYIAKKQNQASNASALLAKSMAFQPKKKKLPEADTRDINKLMIQQCANTLSRDQELSGPEVVSYLMGWDDRFVSHNFVPIYWDEVSGALKRVFPDLQKSNILRRTARVLNCQEPPEANEASRDPSVRLQVVEGAFVLKDQLKEYTDRGVELGGMNYYDYHVDTYDGAPRKKKAPRGEVGAEADADEQDEAEREERRGAGRPASKRVAYLPQAKRKGCRIIRGANLETLPHFIGKWFPAKDVGEYYYASMLALLKPWRALTDLVDEDGTFVTAFEKFMATATISQRRVVQNINYFHECSAQGRLRKDTPIEELTGGLDLGEQVRREMQMETELEDVEDDGMQLGEADVDNARNHAYASREYLYGLGAMNVAQYLGIFDTAGAEAPSRPSCQRASYDETLKFREWGEKLGAMSKRLEILNSNTVPMPVNDAAVSSSAPLQYDEGVVPIEAVAAPLLRTAVQQAAVDILNSEQRRAHDIIESHLRRTMEGIEQEQLLMIVRGEGGTGKTVLLNAIAHTFDFLERTEWLAKTATTGVAASLVSGQTVHGWAVLPVNAADDPAWMESAGPATVERRKKNILPVKYVNVDECSMLTKQILAQLSQVIGKIRASEGQGVSSRPFGGTNMILFGDFHQFPPVGDPSAALYSERNKRTQSEIGLAIYHQFTTVVTLTEQKRIVDDVWRDLLKRLRVGGCTERDIVELRSLLVSDPSCRMPDWNSPPWDTAVLVTPRHGARVLWNTAALRRHCAKTGHQMYIVQAEDTVGRNEDALDMKQRVVVAGMPMKKTGKLAERVEIAIGMRAMVLVNIATEADLANGTRGEVVDLKLDPRESNEKRLDPETGAVILQYPPVVVLFKPDSSRFPAFEGLPAGILPIVPSKASFPIMGKTKVTRRQLAMTPAYAFTDYKSQGQSLGCVCIDLEKPPSGKLTPFSAYVALSRSSGRDAIRLLRGFDLELFTTHPSEELRAEDARLDKLTAQTKLIYRM